MVRRNQGLVHLIAHRYAGRGQADDLVQEGNLALLKAIEKFDLRRKVKFSTYAVWWLKALMRRYQRGNISVVKREEMRGDLSLSNPIGDGDATHLDIIEEPGQHQGERLERLEVSARVRAAIERLTWDRTGLRWQVVAKRLLATSPATLQQLADEHGYSRENVRQVELSVLAQLKVYLAAQFGEVTA